MALEIAVEPPAASPAPLEDPVIFTTASLIAARLCGLCGSFVAGSALDRHQEHHDLLERLGHLINEAAGSGEEPTLF